MTLGESKRIYLIEWSHWYWISSYLHAINWPSIANIETIGSRRTHSIEWIETDDIRLVVGIGFKSKKVW